MVASRATNAGMRRWLKSGDILYGFLVQRRIYPQITQITQITFSGWGEAIPSFKESA
jgi:hypothetical protein